MRNTADDGGGGDGMAMAGMLTSTYGVAANNRCDVRYTDANQY